MAGYVKRKIIFIIIISHIHAGVPLAGSCTNTTQCTTNNVNSECKGGTCQCKVSFYEQNKTCVARVPIGGRCTNTTNCTANAKCKGGKCQCMVTSYLQNNKCKPKIALGSPCNATKQCRDGNTTCMRNCTCKDTFYTDTTCKPRIYPNNTCGRNDSCVDNAYCYKTICVCDIGYTTTLTSCNAAVTMAVVEISTIITCFMLAYLEVLK